MIDASIPIQFGLATPVGYTPMEIIHNQEIIIPQIDATMPIIGIVVQTQTS
jgi:hypothetical protein